MGLKSTFKKFFDLDDDLDEVLRDAFSREKENETRNIPQQHTVNRKPGRSPYVENNKVQAASNVVNLKSVQQPTKVMLVEPLSFDDVQIIADHLRHNRSVVFNLQRVNLVDAKRMIDFLSGAVYAIDGHIQRLSSETFMCAPAHVDINGVITEAMEKKF
ncbi:MAG: cell division protein SepF [Tuberibacillus sp.]